MLLMLVALAFVLAGSAVLLLIGGILSAVSPAFRHALIGDQQAELHRWFDQEDTRR